VTGNKKQKYARVQRAALVTLSLCACAFSAEPDAASKTAFLYEPASGVAADVIPFFRNDQFHLLHLQKKPGQIGWDWAQLVTPDFVSYEHTGISIPGCEDEDSPDLAIYTGSVIEKDGLLYAFYTGNNRFFKPQGKPFQQIFLATGSDGQNWVKKTGFLFNTGERPDYRFPDACRDPFVFRNPEKNEYGMLITAASVDYPSGSLAYAGSRDLIHWRLDEPFCASGRFPGYECPDLFYWGDRWYLIFSTYSTNPGWATRYMTAPSLDGPWTSPVDDFFDGGSLYAAKTVSDGSRRFLCGTLTRRDPDAKGVRSDIGPNGWSGRILIYELHRRDDGTLGVRIPPSVEESFGPPEPVRLTANSVWGKEGRGLRTDFGPARLPLGALPDRCLLQFSLTVPPTGRAGVWVGGDADGKHAFRLFVDTHTQRLVWDRGHLPLGSDPEKERPYRPLHVRPGDRIAIKIVLDGDAAVACVNDDVCLSVRMYDRRDNTFGIWADTVGAGIADMQLRSMQNP
jgi:beta-fructofuranosidase